MKQKTSAFFKDTTHLMVYGHESWLELAGSHGHVGENVTVYLKWGHNMQVDGLARKEEMKALVVHPNGDKKDIQVAGGGPEYYVLNFNAQVTGLYHVISNITGNYVIDNEGKFQKGTRKDYPDAAKATFYNQFAQVIVPVGHDLEGTPPKADIPLEIQPEMWKQWRLGDEINFQIIFRGEPLDGTAVDVAYSGPGGYRQWQEMTGRDGRLALQAREPGRYLLIARCRVPEGEEGVYDELSLTATFALMVTK